MTDVEDSIFLSVKNSLGIPDDIKDFDADIYMHINGAISTLRQLGVGPVRGYTVCDPEQTFREYLGYRSKSIPDVRLYLYYKTRLGFDPPTSSMVMEALKESLAECEWRLHTEAEVPDSFMEDDYE